MMVDRQNPPMVDRQNPPHHRFNSIHPIRLRAQEELRFKVYRNKRSLWLTSSDSSQISRLALRIF